MTPKPGTPTVRNVPTTNKRQRGMAPAIRPGHVVWVTVSEASALQFDSREHQVQIHSVILHPTMLI